MKRFTALLCAVLLCVNAIPWPGMLTGTLIPFPSPVAANDPASYDNFSQFEKHMEKWPVLVKAGLNAHASRKDKGTYIIPGMERTTSLNDDGVAETCVEMVPQGMCLTDEYMLITAYCHDHHHNSVMYVLDRKSHKYLKTVVLEGKPHAGSVSWDPVWRHVWLSTGSTGKAGASYLRIRDIDKYNFKKTGKPLPFTYTAHLSELTRNSFMTATKDGLYAGTFTLNEPTMRLQKFTFSTAGHLASNKGGKGAEVAESLIIGQQCQGIAFSDNYIFMTFSYGPYIPGTLCIYPRNAARLLKSDAIKTYTLPPCLEQPWVDGSDLYLIWESPARCFRNEQITHVDRVIALDINKLVN